MPSLDIESKLERLIELTKILDSTYLYVDKKTKQPWIHAGDLGYLNLATRDHAFDIRDLDLLEVGRAGFLLAQILKITYRKLDEKT